MTKVKSLFSLAGIFFLTAAILAGSMLTRTNQNLSERAAAATNMYTVPQNLAVERDQEFQFSVAIDTGENYVTGVDILLGFEPSIIQIDSLEAGMDIANFGNTITESYNNTSGDVSYAVFTIDKNLAVNGSEIEVLKIKGRVLADAPFGETSLYFHESSAVAATGESQNALVQLTHGTLTVIDTEPEPTNEPTDEPFVPGDPNSCGGTCGSNANCESGLFCYQGYCRNPSCSGESDCNCNSEDPDPTQEPTQAPYVPTQKPQTRTKTSEPIVVNLTPEPELETESDEPNFWENTVNTNQNPTEYPTLEPLNLQDQETDNITPWIIGALVIGGVIIIFIAIRLYKDANLPKSHPPVIKL